MKVKINYKWIGQGFGLVISDSAQGNTLIDTRHVGRGQLVNPSCTVMPTTPSHTCTDMLVQVMP